MAINVHIKDIPSVLQVQATAVKYILDHLQSGTRKVLKGFN